MTMMTMRSDKQMVLGVSCFGCHNSKKVPFLEIHTKLKYELHYL
jgi:hypothetical protein